MNKAVFIDRDGTLNVEVEYLRKADQLKLIAGTAEALKLLHNEAFKVVVITNQSGIARGYLSERELLEIHAHLREMLAEESAAVDAMYYCPHHPEARIAEYRRECHCRKPLPGMIHQAARDLQIDLNNAFVVGDKAADLQAATAAGCRALLVRTGYGQMTESGLTGQPPAYIADDLLAAARWIVKHSAAPAGE